MPDFSQHRISRPLTGSHLSVKYEREETREEMKPTKKKTDPRLGKPSKLSALPDGMTKDEYHRSVREKHMQKLREEVAKERAAGTPKPSFKLKTPAGIAAAR